MIIPLPDVTQEEHKSVLVVLEAYKLKCLKCGLNCHLPRHYRNIVSVLNKLYSIEGVK